jgi:hypothetical protein
MNIYILLSAPVIGEINHLTKKERITLCENCNIKEVAFINPRLVFARWNGEDLISILGEFFITERMKKRLDTLNCQYKATLFEVDFKEEIKKKKNIESEANQKECPKFYHVSFRKSGRGLLDSWFKFISRCEVCEREKWMMKTDGYTSSGDPNLIGKEIDNPSPRNVYEDSWENEDVFLLQDEYNIPIVTQKFVDVLLELGVKINQRGGVWLRETNWIDDEGNVIE